jgi:hypothetical protein
MSGFVLIFDFSFSKFRLTFSGLSIEEFGSVVIPFIRSGLRQKAFAIFLAKLNLSIYVDPVV